MFRKSSNQNKSDKMFDHKDLVNYIKNIYNNKGEGTLMDVSEILNKHDFNPDLVDEINKVAVEIGCLSGGFKKIENMLTKYNEVWWIPYPDIKNGLPFFHVLIFNSKNTLDIHETKENLSKLKKEYTEKINDLENERKTLRFQNELAVLATIEKLSEYSEYPFSDFNRKLQEFIKENRYLINQEIE